MIMSQRLEDSQRFPSLDYILLAQGHLQLAMLADSLLLLSPPFDIVVERYDN